MTKPTGKPRGRPASGDQSITKSMGGVRVRADELEEYGEVAKLEGMTRGEWIRDTLNAKAKRIRKKHGA